MRIRFVLGFVLSALLAFPPVPGESAPSVSPDARPAFGIVAAGVKPFPQRPNHAELTLQNGVRLWLAVWGHPAQAVTSSTGRSPANSVLSRLQLLPPNAETTFVGAFPEPGSRVTLTLTLNSGRAATLNIFQVVLAALPGGVHIPPHKVVEVLQDLNAILAIRHAAAAFLPPPKTGAGWSKAAAKAALELKTLVKDEDQVRLLINAFKKLGKELSQQQAVKVVQSITAFKLSQLIIDQGVFIYATKGKEPAVLFTRTTPAREEAYTPAQGSLERKAILDALRTVIEKDLNQKVIFQVRHLKVKGSWAFLDGTPRRPDGKPIDLSIVNSRYRRQVEAGAFDEGVSALLHERNGRWAVTTFNVGATDVVWGDWCKEYGAPGSIFPYNYGRCRP